MSERAEMLAHELAMELQSPKPGLQQPIIVEEPIAFSDRFRVTVIWDKWSRMLQRDRQASIREAYRVAKPHSLPLLSVATAYTDEEARQFHIEVVAAD